VADAERVRRLLNRPTPRIAGPAGRKYAAHERRIYPPGASRRLPVSHLRQSLPRHVPSVAELTPVPENAHEDAVEHVEVGPELRIDSRHEVNGGKLASPLGLDVEHAPVDEGVSASDKIREFSARHGVHSDFADQPDDLLTKILTKEVGDLVRVSNIVANRGRSRLRERVTNRSLEHRSQRLHLRFR